MKHEALSEMIIGCAVAVQAEDELGEVVADMLVEDLTMVENKAVQAIHPKHEVQLVNYLTAKGVDIGLLLNFGADRLQFKRKYRTYRPKEAREEEDDQ